MKVLFVSKKIALDQLFAFGFPQCKIVFCRMEEKEISSENFLKERLGLVFL
jgi:hypothetical protein